MDNSNTAAPIVTQASTLPAAIAARYDAVVERANAGREGIGEELIALKTESPHGTFLPSLKERGMSARTAQFYMQAAKDPTAREVKIKRDRDARAANAHARAYLIQPSVCEGVLEWVPGKALPGEVHEASKGFKFAILRAKKERKADRIKESFRWEDTALGHLKFLVAHSNLPAYMGMSTEEIINLLNWRRST